MKKFYFLLLFFITNIVIAQTNYHSGFYQVDSLFFTVHWNIGNNQQLQWSVNRFTEDSWSPYVGGIWLKNNSDTQNTWENNHFVGEPCFMYGYPNNTDLKRGNLKRVNVIRVRLVDTSTGTVTKDSVYTIGLGNSPTIYTLFATIDSTDLVEVFQNYDQDIKKRAWLQIVKPNGLFEVSQPVEFKIAANSSACLPNKGVSFKATSTVPISGLNNFKTSIFTKNTQEQIKKIKIRVGGNGQATSFGVNEICLRIIDYPQWKIGGVKNTIGSWYVNGSYWSLGFPQVKPDERYVAGEYAVPKDSVSLVAPQSYVIYDSLSTYQDGVYGLRVFFFPQFGENALPFDSIFIPMSLFAVMPMDSLITVVTQNGRKKIVGAIESGSSSDLQKILQRIITTTNYDTLKTLIDIDNWARYITIVNFFGLQDAVFHNCTIGITNLKKLFILIEDFDYIGSSNNWDDKIFHDNSVNEDIDYTVVHEIIQKKLLVFPQFLERLQLVYQDMLNTGFRPFRTVPIVDSMISGIMPEYEYYHQSWGGNPNGGAESSTEEAILRGVGTYLAHRPDATRVSLVDKFQPEMNYSISDTNQVNIVFDSVPKGTVVVELNSLRVNTNWSGAYFPTPGLYFSYSTVPGFSDINIKEYPDSGQSFRIYSDTNITITFVRGLGILPIELVSFTGSYNELTNQNNLIWITATEKDNDYFVVEKSLDGINFLPIGTVDGAGNSNTELTYTLDDRNPVVGNNYYRLLQYDFDGSSTTSPIINIRVAKIEKVQTTFIEKIYPNSTTGLLNVDIIVAEDVLDLNYKVSNIIGQAMKDEQIQLTKGRNTLVLDASNYAQGVYLIHLLNKQNGIRLESKFVKQ
jgi:hypothetical protein